MRRRKQPHPQGEREEKQHHHPKEANGHHPSFCHKLRELNKGTSLENKVDCPIWAK